MPNTPPQSFLLDEESGNQIINEEGGDICVDAVAAPPPSSCPINPDTDPLNISGFASSGGFVRANLGIDEVGVYFGDVEDSGGIRDDVVGNWHDDSPSVSNPEDYEFRMVTASGDVQEDVGLPTNTWLAVSEFPLYFVEADSGNAFVQASYTMEFRDVNDPTGCVGSFSGTLTAEYDVA